MSAAKNTKERRGVTGRHVLFMFVAFFGAIFVANAVFITLALKSFPGESQKKSYLQGIHYNDRLAEREAQEQLGWHAQISKVERGGDGAFVDLLLLDAGNEPLNAMTIEGDLTRPAHSQEDQRILFSAAGDGLYRGALENAAPGVWNLAAVATNARDEQFNIRARIIIP